MSQKMNITHVEAMGYGLAIVSVLGFEEMRKSLKIRSKKMISRFDKDPTIFYEFTQKGLFIPIPHIHMYDYNIDILMDGNKECLADWEILGEWEDFYIDVLKGDVWVLSIEAMQEWNYSLYANQDILPSSYILHGQWIESSKGIRLNLERGLYALKIIGAKSRDQSRYVGRYGFFLHLTPVREIPSSYVRDLSEIDYSGMFKR